VHKDDSGAKYYSYKYRDVAYVCDSSMVKQQHCVIVEDLISAIKVGRHVPAMPLMSTKIRDIHVNYLISKGFTMFTVFLDDDNSSVIKDSIYNYNILSKIGICNVIHSKGKDPKEYTDAELISMLAYSLISMLT
jgi:hypothetical protein